MTNNLYFLCSGNSCRGQIAEGYAKKFLPDWNVQSAGVRAEDINPQAVKVMAEDNVDISQQKSKKIDDLLLKQANLVVTLSGEARDKSALPKNTRWLDWPISDPTLATGSQAEITQAYRDVRDDIKQNILELKKNID
ncbi:arsenate reductase/protein-tyrosine-phosphatase family protein [Companilactobacillus zhachilii]|jgi:Protein-tyrosine-phosphatase|uniref:Arsenate reductase (Thioredoxin) n=1 Tax=Companilactobacillus zhachilii TaxID=2304606 RepID=A0A386PSW2_9LACO|nr:arsenate reductase (thioredoxin) [Companilactobacillus zhachilii]AYE39151.1 arsenate reductase (thioredoxin) [Companilactobacillus zhachilii]